MSTWKDLKNLPGKTYAIAQVEYEGAKFWVGRDPSFVYASDTELKFDMYAYVGLLTGYKARWPKLWGSDSSCAYKRFFPSLDAHPDAHKWLSYYLADMDYSRAITCYLTKQDGPVKTILPPLLKAGFNQVAVNKSIHTDGYNVYLLVHPGLADPLKFKSDKYQIKKKSRVKAKKDKDAESEWIEELE